MQVHLWEECKASRQKVGGWAPGTGEGVGSQRSGSRASGFQMNSLEVYGDGSKHGEGTEYQTVSLKMAHFSVAGVAQC